MRAHPENQTFWRRVGAALIDFALFTPLYWLNATFWDRLATPEVRIGWFVFYSLALVVYSVSMHAVYGQTVGKMATRIMLLSVDGTRIRWRHALLRDAPVLTMALVGIGAEWHIAGSGTNPFSPEGAHQGGLLRESLDNASTLWLVLELITMWSNAKRRAIHDFIAGTVVVRVKRTAEGA